jgi:molecular chaperone DnaJ
MKDYYVTLGVAGDSSTRQIKWAYKKLVKQWHPDLHP